MKPRKIGQTPNSLCPGNSIPRTHSLTLCLLREIEKEYCSKPNRKRFCNNKKRHNNSIRFLSKPILCVVLT